MSLRPMNTMRCLAPACPSRSRSKRVSRLWPHCGLGPVGPALLWSIRLPASAMLTTARWSVDERACSRSPRKRGHSEVSVAESVSATMLSPFFELTLTLNTNGHAATGDADGSSTAPVWLPEESDTKLAPWKRVVVSAAAAFGRY